MTVDSPAATAPTSDSEMDMAIQMLGNHADAFALLSAQRKMRLLQRCLRQTVAVAPRWAAEACRAKRILVDSNRAAEEWLAGPVVTARFLRLLIESMRQIAVNGIPNLGIGTHARPNGGFAVDVFPAPGFDAFMLEAFSAAAYFPPAIARAEEARARQACAYRQLPDKRRREVCAVLGAGNVASIPATDVLTKMFVDGYVCILKMHPVNAWLGPVLSHAFQPLIDEGYLEIVYGNAEAGAHLCRSRGVSAIHVTGSRATHDAIVWGDDDLERHRRRFTGTPRTGGRAVTSELGNVSPVLVAPSVYSDKELHVIVQGIASAKMHNVGFNCNSPQVIVTSQSWPQRGEFLRRLEAALESIPPRYDYYPGVRDRYADLLLRATNRRFAVDPGEPLQVTLVTEVDYRSASPLFSEETFCPILAETPLPVADEAEFLVRAAEFANKRLAGNLNVTVFVPGHLATRTLCWKPLDAAIEALEYGTVSVNHWPGVSFGLGCTPWGAFPNGTLRQPRSGIGWVHNSFMLEGMEKVVFRGPLLTDVTPPWFAGNRNALAIAKRLLRMEASPSMLGFLGLAAAGIRG